MTTIVPFDTLTDLYTNLSKKYAGQNKAGFAMRYGKRHEQIGTDKPRKHADKHI